MRAVLCYGATERNGGRDEARRGLAECRRFIESNTRPLVRGVVGLHASFTVSDETIREAGALCRELGTVLHVHVAEDRADVEDARRRGYRGPARAAAGARRAVRGSILAHGVHLTRDQVRTASDAWLLVRAEPALEPAQRGRVPRRARPQVHGSRSGPTAFRRTWATSCRPSSTKPRSTASTAAGGRRARSTRASSLVAELFGSARAAHEGRRFAAIPSVTWRRPAARGHNRRATS